jgi:hypothetical protein
MQQAAWKYEMPQSELKSLPSFLMQRSSLLLQPLSIVFAAAATTGTMKGGNKIIRHMKGHN